MKLKVFFVPCLLYMCLCSFYADAQYKFFTPPGSFAIEVSLNNPPDGLIRLPIYRNSISSLAVIGDQIIGGTKADDGLSPFLFLASLSQKDMKRVLDLQSVIPGQKSIQSGFYKSPDGILYAGTIANGERNGGHIIKVETGAGSKISVSDLGTPLSGEGIYALTGNKKGTELYGISYPSGTFFTFDIATRKVNIYDQISVKEKDRNIYGEFALNPDDYLSRSLIVDAEGNVFGSAPVNRLFYFNPATKKISFLDTPIPFVWGREVLGRVDSWAKDGDGILYGGNAGDGQLFSVNPRTKEVVNLGKPILMNRMPALVFGRDSRLYGIAGAEPGYAHLFSYRKQSGFYDLGNPQFEMKAPGLEQGIDWRGFRIGSMTSTEDGKFIVMGEDEALSQLMIFPVNSK